MAGVFYVEAKNYQLDDRFGTGASSGTWAGVCNGAPSSPADALSKELTGGSYGRVQLNLNVASNGTKNLASNPTWNIPSGIPFSHLSFWKVSSGGTSAEYLGSTSLSSPESAYPVAATYTLTGVTFRIDDPA